MTLKLVAASALVPLALMMGGCGAPTPESCQMNYTATGAAVGAVAGAALGAGIAALSHGNAGVIGVAALGGALVVGAIGAIAGAKKDKACHDMALTQALDRAVLVNQSMTATLATAGTPVTLTTAAPSTTPPKQAPTYQTVAWANSMTSHSGAITPLASVVGAAEDQVCMTYADQQVVNGQTQTVNGKACRGKDGEWKPAT